MYEWESCGKGNLRYSGIFLDNERPNGYNLGKKWAEITVNMWKEDIKRGLLFEYELYIDVRYPEWWLDEIFSRTIR